MHGKRGFWESEIAISAGIIILVVLMIVIPIISCREQSQMKKMKKEEATALLILAPKPVPAELLGTVPFAALKPDITGYHRCGDIFWYDLGQPEEFIGTHQLIVDPEGYYYLIKLSTSEFVKPESVQGPFRFELVEPAQQPAESTADDTVDNATGSVSNQPAKPTSDS